MITVKTLNVCIILLICFICVYKLYVCVCLCNTTTIKLFIHMHENIR